MRVSILATKFEIDKRRLPGKILASVREAMLDAVGDFLRNAAPAVPIDTGMARGSFLNMMHLLELNGRNIPSIPGGIPNTPQSVAKSGRPWIYIHSGGGKYPKTPATARDKFSTPIGQILKKVGNTVQFAYKSEVVHYNVNDEFNPHGPNWLSFRRGTEAFANRLRKFKPIDVSQYIMKTSYIIGTHKTGYTKMGDERTIT